MKVGVILGSLSDIDVARECFETLKEFGISYEKRVISAHRALPLLVEYVENMEKNDVALTIAFAGKAAHLAGVIAGLSTKPVIGVPVKSSTLDGLDALLSTVQMPSGVPVATVAINGSKNAAVLAAQILSIRNEELSKKMKDYKKSLLEKVNEMDEKIKEDGEI